MKPLHRTKVRCLVAIAALVAHGYVLAAPSLCAATERSVLACLTKTKTFELCASKDLSATTGYLQYRAGSNGVPSFRFPERHESSLSKFRVSLLAKGAMLSFSNGEFTYEIVEPLKYTSTIVVSRGAVTSATIECQNNTDSLTRTTNLNWFRELGIYE